MPSDRAFLYQRDGWRCRFCGCRVVVPGARKVLQVAFPDVVGWPGKDHGKHAAFYALSATIDHITPHSRGGDNSPENLVTTCQPCNFGRNRWLLQEVALSDPRERAPVIDAWDGLSRLLAKWPKPNRPAASSSAASARVDSDQPIEASARHATTQGPAGCEHLPLSWRRTTDGVLVGSLAAGDWLIQLFGIGADGRVFVPWSVPSSHRAALRRFSDDFALVVDDAGVDTTTRTHVVRKKGGGHILLDDVLARNAAVCGALETLRNAIANHQLGPGEAEAVAQECEPRVQPDCGNDTLLALRPGSICSPTGTGCETLYSWF